MQGGCYRRASIASHRLNGLNGGYGRLESLASACGNMSEVRLGRPSRGQAKTVNGMARCGQGNAARPPGSALIFSHGPQETPTEPAGKKLNWGHPLPLSHGCPTARTPSNRLEQFSPLFALAIVRILDLNPLPTARRVDAVSPLRKVKSGVYVP
jgi:hypothetical protein